MRRAIVECFTENVLCNVGLNKCTYVNFYKVLYIKKTGRMEISAHSVEYEVIKNEQLLGVNIPHMCIKMRKKKHIFNIFAKKL